MFNENRDYMYIHACKAFFDTLQTNKQNVYNSSPNAAMFSPRVWIKIVLPSFWKEICSERKEFGEPILTF